MIQIVCVLFRFLIYYEELWVDEFESIDDDFVFDGLDGIDDDGNSMRVELFE